MPGPPLNVPILLAMFVASETEAATGLPGQRMFSAEALQMELWRQRRAIINTLTAHAFPPPAAAIEPDQLDLI